MRVINQISENNYYDKILKFYSSHYRDFTKMEIWKNRYIINLMKTLKYSKSKCAYNEMANIVKNSIILMLSLFDDLPPDCLYNKGQDLKSISQEERENVKKILLNVIEK